MTTQLRDSRSQIDQFTRNLQQAVQELERRRQLIETVLENIPTGVISLDAAGVILRVNTSVSRMFGVDSSESHSLEELVGADAARIVHYLMRRSLRMGVVSREIETVAAGRVLHLAVTVSSLGPRRANTGYVLVLDDLTEVLKAQKVAAWQEVARRVAHEIKNPLTPIQLSAQRLRKKFFEKSPDFETIFDEATNLIVNEVTSLKHMVDEFSKFARLPTPQMAHQSLHDVINEVTALYRGAHKDVELIVSLDQDLPSLNFDREQLKRVMVNLLDNAIQAMQHKGRVWLSTKHDAKRRLAVVSVADEGPGIAPED